MNMITSPRAFYGQYRHSVDEKGRVSIPAAFRYLLLGQRGSFFLNLGFEGCIMAYPEEKWSRVVRLVNEIALDDENTRWFKRQFFSAAKEVSTDQQGRILLPQFLKDYATITTDVVVVGVADYVEIWDAATWDKSVEERMSSYARTAETLIRSALAGKKQVEEGSTGPAAGT
jgi:MraZ protein